MKIRNGKLIWAVLLSVMLMVFLPLAVSAADTEITVIVDGTELSFDVPPVAINGRTMVPMRKIFEFLGAEVQWIQEESGIRATTETLDLYMRLGKQEYTINGKTYQMDVAPLAIDGRTLVPLRAVMEAFSADVQWDQRTSSAIINTPNKYAENLDHSFDEILDSTHLRTSYDDIEYFDLQIDGTKLYVTCMTTDPNMKEFGVSINGNSLVGITKVKTGEKCTAVIDLDKMHIPDHSMVEVYTRDGDETMYWSYIYRCLFIDTKGSSYCFTNSPIWEYNQKILSEWVDPKNYLNSDLPQSIIDQSNIICEGITNDYQKLLAIHDWVCDNIYYDWDDFYNASNHNISSEIEDLLTNPHSVCQGYADLFTMLTQAQGIPCRQIIGYALGVSDIGYWDNNNVENMEANHAWNQAYIDHHWINVDTTWDSANKYENGEYIYGGIDNHLYFDTSNMFLSYNHKIIAIQ